MAKKLTPAQTKAKRLFQKSVLFGMPDKPELMAYIYNLEKRINKLEKKK